LDTLNEDAALAYDKEWIVEALVNIIKNSIEHTKEGGIIEVSQAESPVMIKLVIKDNGEGIPEEDLPHIFERFYKGRNNYSSTSTGIGLSLSKSII
jgi:signal transduction histidine kinase